MCPKGGPLRHQERANRPRKDQCLILKPSHPWTAEKKGCRAPSTSRFRSFFSLCPDRGFRGCRTESWATPFVSPSCTPPHRCTMSFEQEISNLVGASDSGQNIQQELLDRLQNVADAVMPGTLHLVGSSASGLNLPGADVDLTLLVEDSELAAGDTQVPLEIQRSLVSLLAATIDERMNFSKVEALTATRVPIVKLTKEEGSDLSCDISVGQFLSIENTRLLQTYAALDHRMRQLCFVVKRWAQNRRVNLTQRGTPSSYAWCVLVVYYLQRCDPPVLCNLQSVELGDSTTKVTRGARSFCTDLTTARDLLGNQPNTSSIRTLTAGFFHFFSFEFDFEHDCASVCSDVLRMPKAKKGWTQESLGRDVRQDRHLFSIEVDFSCTRALFSGPTHPGSLRLFFTPQAPPPTPSTNYPS